MGHSVCGAGWAGVRTHALSVFSTCSAVQQDSIHCAAQRTAAVGAWIETGFLQRLKKRRITHAKVICHSLLYRGSSVTSSTFLTTQQHTTAQRARHRAGRLVECVVNTTAAAASWKLTSHTC